MSYAANGIEVVTDRQPRHVAIAREKVIDVRRIRGAEAQPVLHGVLALVLGIAQPNACRQGVAQVIGELGVNGVGLVLASVLIVGTDRVETVDEIGDHTVGSADGGEGKRQADI